MYGHLVERDKCTMDKLLLDLPDDAKSNRELEMEILCLLQDSLVRIRDVKMNGGEVRP